ncbi:S1 family peptidase [Arthrobacter sp. 92]|jgi:secreted trypsin-like serine protease|uniref:S1 family peptidase n=1 Tax=Arthrobacter sp. 92 TaxID=3418175 RepID=UPI003D02E4E0
MRKMMKSAIACVVAALFAVAGTSAARAADPIPLPPPGASPLVVGGERADLTRWAVQLVFVQGQGQFGCTGEAISESWVLTAKHCVAGISSMLVFYSNSTTNPGTPVAADRVYGSPSGDVGLVHLSASHSLRSYPDLTNSYEPGFEDSGTIMGYGLRADKQGAKGLYEAEVSVTNASADGYGGPAIHVTGVTGAANHGDSGGPLIVGGEIVGVCSTGDLADPGADVHAGSNYANLSVSRDWIHSTSGV